jgi:metallo-beta-lactamase family protein
MHLEFHGAVRTVTGSCYLLQVGDKRILIDCGMFQGGAKIERRNENAFPFSPQSIDRVLVTHGHIDHCGMIPRLVQQGYKGPILATRATSALLPLMLKDSAHIQESEASWKNRKAKRARRELVEPLYTMVDAEAAIELIQPIKYGETVDVCTGVTAVFKDAGHILGSAFIEVTAEEKGRKVKIIFSGDLGNRDQALIRDPAFAEDADLLLIESTYGDRQHKSRPETLAELNKILEAAYDERSTVVIPAFAVGRTQEILYRLHQLHQEGRLPGFRVFVDSPMAISATKIYREQSECFDYETMRMLMSGEGPLFLPDVQYTRATEQSRAINFVTDPAIIISASGMCDAGRILHHLKHNLWKRSAHIVFIGYQAHGSLGRRIIEGEPRVKIFREEIAVAANIHTIGGLSAHADQTILLDWTKHLAPSKPLVYVVHGEEDSSKVFAGELEARFDLEARLPEWHERLEL